MSGPLIDGLYYLSLSQKEGRALDATAELILDDNAYLERLPTITPNKTPRCQRLLVPQREKELQYWHFRFAHSSLLKRTIKCHAIDGLPPTLHIFGSSSDLCIDCLKGKQYAKNHSVVSCTSRTIGELIYVDLHAKGVESHSKKKY